jgi:hypothetical protein
LGTVLAFNLFTGSAPEMCINNTRHTFGGLKRPFHAAVKCVVTTFESIEAWGRLEQALRADFRQGVLNVLRCEQAPFGCFIGEPLIDFVSHR